MLAGLGLGARSTAASTPGANLNHADGARGLSSTRRGVSAADTGTFALFRARRSRTGTRRRASRTRSSSAARSAEGPGVRCLPDSHDGQPRANYVPAMVKHRDACRRWQFAALAVGTWSFGLPIAAAPPQGTRRNRRPLRYQARIPADLSDRSGRRSFAAGTHRTVSTGERPHFRADVRVRLRRLKPLLSITAVPHTCADLDSLNRHSIQRHRSKCLSP